MDEQALQARAQTITAEGEQRYGKESWGALIGAIGRAGPTSEQVAATLAQPDAVAQFNLVGRELLLKEMTSEDRDTASAAEAAYNRLRERERESRHPTSAYRKFFCPTCRAADGLGALRQHTTGHAL